jgi:polysaccharide pyruvyl transferase WcaK-like protein
MQRFLIGFFMAWTVLLVKGSMVQFPQTFGPYSNPIARLLAQYLLKRSSVVIARDERSRKVAQSLLGPNREVWLSPDVAFALEVVQPRKIELFPSSAEDSVRNVIGLNVNGLMANGGYTRRNMFGLKLDYRSMLPELVNALLKVHTGEIWLVPHTYGPAGSVESDPEACRRLRDALPEESQRRVRLVAGEYDQHEIKGVIGCCDFFIGSRMHACIAALSQGIPCVGIAYSMKFEGVFESVGMNGWVVDGRNTANAEAVVRVIELYSRRDEIRADLARNAQEARSRLRHVFKLLVETAAQQKRSGCSATA